MQYRVNTFREAGLEAKWIRTNGRPIIAVRDPNGTHEKQREGWWHCTSEMFNTMKKVGVRKGFHGATCLPAMFSIY